MAVRIYPARHQDSRTSGALDFPPHNAYFAVICTQNVQGTFLHVNIKKLFQILFVHRHN